MGFVMALSGIAFADAVPAVYLTNPQNNTNGTANPVDLHFFANDVEDSTLTCYLYVTDELSSLGWNPANYVFIHRQTMNNVPVNQVSYFTYTFPSAGSYEWTIRCDDSFGNQKWADWFVRSVHVQS